MMLSDDRRIVNEGSVNLISDEYFPAVSWINNQCLSTLPIRSVLVRGSVCSGKAKPPYSDLDMVIILQRETPHAEKIISKIALDAEKKFLNIESVDLTAVTLEDLTQNPSFAGLLLNLRVLSCVFDGEDILSTLGGAYADKTLVKQVYGDLPKDLVYLQDYFRSEVSRSYAGRVRPPQFWCRWTMRVLLRASVCLVFAKRPVFTTNLQEATRLACESFPEFADLFEKIHILERHPIDDRKTISDFLNEAVPIFLKLWYEHYETEAN